MVNKWKPYDVTNKIQAIRLFQILGERCVMFHQITTLRTNLIKNKNHVQKWRKVIYIPFTARTYDLFSEDQRHKNELTKNTILH